MEATAVVLEGIVCVSNDEPTVEASRNGYTRLLSVDVDTDN